MTEPSMPEPARIDSGQPGQQAASAPEQQDGPGLSPAEEARLGDLLAKRDASAAAAPVRMKVEGPHASLHYGGLTIGTEYTDVPPHLVGPMTTAAAEAGVTITQES